MVLANKGLELAARGLSKVLSPIRKAFELIGSKISGAFASLANKFLQVIQKIPGVSQVTNLARTAGQGMQIAKTGLTQVFNSATGNVFRRGLEKAPSRLITKLFGPKTAKMVANSTNMFKSLNLAAKGIKIPVIGPIIVAVTSILAGDPLGKTLFRTLGTVMGGMIGSGIGTAIGGPPGTAIGMLLGEILGEFIGTFIYEVFNGDASGKKGIGLITKKIGQILSAPGKIAKHLIGFAFSILGNIANFFEDGVRRFIEDFPVVDISGILGLPSALGLVSGLFGMDDPKFMDGGKVNRLPNLALLAFPPLLLPHLIKSFFPSAKVKESEEKEKLEAKGGNLLDRLHEETTGESIESDLTTITVDGKKYSRGISGSGETFGGKGGSTYGGSNNVLDNLHEAHLAETSSSTASSAVSNVSSQASYEQSSNGTVILEKPKRSDFGGGRSGASRYQQAMVMYNSQKEMLNSYFKTQVRASLYKI